MNPHDAVDALNLAIKKLQQEASQDYINGLRLRLLEQMRDAAQKEANGNA